MDGMGLMLTPVRKLAAKVLADKWYDHHGEQQLQLLQAALPLLLRLRVGVRVDVAGGDRGEGVYVVGLLV